MAAQGIDAVGEVGPGRLVQVLESRRQAVGPVFLRHAPQGPERVLQPFGQRHIALTPQHDMGVLEAGIGQPEVIQPMIKRLAGNGHAQFAHGSEIRQAHPARLVGLAKDHLLLGAMLGPPGAYPPLQRASDTRAEIGVAAQEFLENRNRPQPRRRLQQRNHLGLENVAQRIRAASVPRGLLL